MAPIARSPLGARAPGVRPGLKVRPAGMGDSRRGLPPPEPRPLKGSGWRRGALRCNKVLATPRHTRRYQIAARVVRPQGWLMKPPQSALLRAPGPAVRQRQISRNARGVPQPEAAAGNREHSGDFCPPHSRPRRARQALPPVGWISSASLTWPRPPLARLEHPPEHGADGQDAIAAQCPRRAIRCRASRQ